VGHIADRGRHARGPLSLVYLVYSYPPILRAGTRFMARPSFTCASSLETTATRITHQFACTLCHFQSAQWRHLVAHLASEHDTALPSRPSVKSAWRSDEAVVMELARGGLC